MGNPESASGSLVSRVITTTEQTWEHLGRLLGGTPGVNIDPPLEAPRDYLATITDFRDYASREAVVRQFRSEQGARGTATRGWSVLGSRYQYYLTGESEGLRLSVEFVDEGGNPAVSPRTMTHLSVRSLAAYLKILDEHVGAKGSGFKTLVPRNAGEAVVRFWYMYTDHIFPNTGVMDDMPAFLRPRELPSQ